MNENQKIVKSFSLSVIMPVFNEERNLKIAVEKCTESLQKLEIDYEIIAVNDGSVDQTLAVAKDLEKGFSMFRCVSHQNNCGIGGAFRTGVEHARGDYVILIPADNPLSSEELRSFVTFFGQFDIIIGVRPGRAGYSQVLTFASFVYNRVLILLLFGLNVKDVNWIQAYRRRIFSDNGIKIEHAGIFFFAEVLIKAKRAGLSMVEVVCPMKERLYGRKTISRLPVIWRIFCDAVGFRLRSVDKK